MKQLLCSFLLLSINAFAQEPQPALVLLKDYPNARDFTLSKDGDEAYLTLQDPAETIALIVCVKRVGDKWLEPEKVSFSSQYRDIEPFLSPDGNRLYFSSNRPKPDRPNAADYDIWYVERADESSAWSEPINVGSPVNTQYDEFYPSVAANGNLYFTTDSPSTKGKDDIFCSVWKGQRFDKPASLSINSSDAEFNAFIASDESYLLYTVYNKSGGIGSGDLYISFRKDDGSWTTAINLGETINTKFMEYCPFFDATTQTLYFTSRRNKVVARDFESVADFMTEATKYANGISKIYQVPFGELLATLKQKTL